MDRPPEQPGAVAWQALPHRWSGLLLTVPALTGAAAMVLAMPAVLGLSWAAIAAVLTGVSVHALLALGALWVAGLLVQTVVLTAAMPGLNVRRALLLNLSGSAVSNLMPFGAAAGVGLGYSMTRRWRIEPERFAAYTAISNAWNVVGKLVVGSLLLLGAGLLGVPLPPGMRALVMYGAAVVLVTVAVGGTLIGSHRAARNVGRLLDRGRRRGGAGRVGRSAHDHGEGVWEAAMLRIRSTTGDVVAAGWGRLTAGVVGYLALQALLLAACLLAVGGQVPLGVVGVAFAAERLLTLIPFTPGGAGFAELGTVGLLSALGVDPVAAAAGVLLYRLFTFMLEIPVGCAGALVWLRLDAVRA